MGFGHDDLVNNTSPSLEEIAKEVIDFANDPSNFAKPVPVVVAGGVYTGKDIAHYQKLGAAGVQMATRFVTTLECDANDRFKRKYIDSLERRSENHKKPLWGLPGRAINNLFLEKVMHGDRIQFKCSFHCLKPCDPKKSLFCIAKALVGARQGEFDEGFAFAGANAYRATKDSCLDELGNFITVKTLMQRLSDEYNAPAC